MDLVACLQETSVTFNAEWQSLSRERSTPSLPHMLGEVISLLFILEHVCHPSPCMHEGRCSVESGHFKCLCPPLFKGDVCESKLHPTFYWLKNSDLSLWLFARLLAEIPEIESNCLGRVLRRAPCLKMGHHKIRPLVSQFSRVKNIICCW